MTWRIHTTLLPALIMIAGCPGESPEPTALARADAWVRVSDPSVDAFADQRPADAVCDDAGWSADPFEQVVEIETEVCDYLTLRQDTLAAIEPGDLVKVLGYYDDLSSPDEPDEGYLALALDGEIVWEYTVAIPATADEFEDSFTVEHSVPLGAELQFHVHNHGPNTWELISVTVTPGE